MHSAGMDTLYSPNGTGRLRFFTSDQNYNETDFGEDFQGKLAGKYYAGRVYQGNFRRRWHLSCGGCTLSVIYSCSEQNAKIDVSQVDEILQNIGESGLVAA